LEYPTLIAQNRKKEQKRDSIKRPGDAIPALLLVFDDWESRIAHQQSMQRSSHSSNLNAFSSIQHVNCGTLGDGIHEEPQSKGTNMKVYKLVFASGLEVPNLDLELLIGTRCVSGL
jgi:hypothetical protein